MKDNSIKQAVQALHRGEVIAFPTETTYGLGCDPRDAKALKQIFSLKERPHHKSMLLVASSFAQVEKVAFLRGAALQLAKKYWPGPLSLILPVKPNASLAQGVMYHGTVGIRFSSSPLVRQLVRAFGFPIVATSANHSGEEPARSVQEVLKSFGDRIPCILDGGQLPKQKSSTLVQCHEDGRIEIVRQGSIRL